MIGRSRVYVIPVADPSPLHCVQEVPDVMSNSISIDPHQSVSAAQSLQSLLGQKATGEFLITAEPAGAVNASSSVNTACPITWLLYCTQGQLNFLTSAVRSRSRLQYLLQHYAPNLTLPQWETFSSDYDYMCSLLTTQSLPRQRVRQLLSMFSVEALAQILTASKLTITPLSAEVQLQPLLIALNFQEVLPRLQDLLQEWRTLHPEVPSLFHCPRLKRVEALHQLVAKNPTQRWLQQLIAQVAPDRCFYELAARDRQNAIELAKKVQPLIQRGLVELTPPPPADAQQGTVSANMLPTTNLSPPETSSGASSGASPGISSFEGFHKISLSNTSQAPAKSFKIACVDDSPTILKEIENCLSGGVDEFSIFPIVNSVQALMWLRRIQPDLILMDVGMPGVNGYELCQLIRGNKQFADIPIIMVTGNTSALDREKAMKVGASDYLTKPFTQTGLLEMVKRHLNLSNVGVGC